MRLSVILTCIFYSSCTIQSVELNESKKQSIQDVSVQQVNESTIHADVDTSTQQTQIIKASGINGMGNAAIAFAPGTLAVPQKIVVEKGEDLTALASSKDLNESGGENAKKASEPLLVTTNASTNPTGTLQISLPYQDRLGLLNTINYYVFFKQIDYSNGKTYVGYLDSSAFKMNFDKKTMSFDTKLFGIFQIVTATVKLKPITKPVESSTPIKNISGQKPASITKVEEQKGISYPEKSETISHNETSNTQQPKTAPSSSSTSGNTDVTLSINQIIENPLIADGYINIFDHQSNENVFLKIETSKPAKIFYRLIQAQETCTIDLQGFDQTIPTLNSNSLNQEGKFKYCFLLIDNNGVKNTTVSNTFEIIYTVSPIEIALINDASDGTLTTIDINNNSPIISVKSLLNILEYAIIDVNNSCQSTSHFTNIVPTATSFNTNMITKICVRGQDIAGNYAYASTNSLSIVSGPYFTGNNKTFNLTKNQNSINITFAQADDDDQTGLVYKICRSQNANLNTIAEMLSINCNSITDWVTFTGSITDVSPQSNTSYYYNILVKDASGNYAIYNQQYLVETDLPYITSYTLNSKTSDSYINIDELNTNDVLVTNYTPSETSQISFQVIDSTISCNSLSNYSMYIPLLNSSFLPNDGSYKICFKITDSANNINFNETSTFIVDSTPPQAPSLALNGFLADGYLNIADKTNYINAPYLTITNPSNASLQFLLTSTVSNCIFQTNFTTVNPVVESSLNVNGTAKICVLAQDNAGNKTFTESSTFTLDLISPTLTTVALHNDLSDGYINALEHTKNDSIFSTLLTTESSTFSYRIVNVDTTSCPTSGYDSIQPTLNSSYFANNNSYKICVLINDLAGNINYHISNIIHAKYDIGSVAVNISAGNGDNVINIDEKSLNQNLVSVTGQNISIIQYQIANFSDLCNSLTNYTPTALTTNLFSTDTTSAVKVCIKIQDSAGNIGYFSSQSFDWRLTPPHISDSVKNFELYGGVDRIMLKFNQATTIYQNLLYKIYRCPWDINPTTAEIIETNCVQRTPENYSFPIEGIFVDVNIAPYTYHIYNIIVVDNFGNKNLYNHLGIKTKFIHTSYTTQDGIFHTFGQINSWQTTQITNTFSNSSLALNSSLVPFIAWNNGTSLHYKSKTATNNTWTDSTTIDLGMNSFTKINLALNSVNDLYFLVGDNTTSYLYSSSNQNNLTISNSFENSTLTFNNMNSPLVYSLINSNINENTTTVFTDSMNDISFRRPDIANGNAGKTYICASSFKNSELLLMEKINETWNYQIANATQISSSSAHICKIAVEKRTNKLHILFKNYDSGAIQYFTKDNNGWMISPTFILNAATFSDSFDIEVDETGVVYVVYESNDTSGKTKILRKVVSTWESTTVLNTNSGKSLNIKIQN